MDVVEQHLIGPAAGVDIEPIVDRGGAKDRAVNFDDVIAVAEVNVHVLADPGERLIAGLAVDGGRAVARADREGMCGCLRDRDLTVSRAGIEMQRASADEGIHVAVENDAGFELFQTKTAMVAGSGGAARLHGESSWRMTAGWLRDEENRSNRNAN